MSVLVIEALVKNVLQGTILISVTLQSIKCIRNFPVSPIIEVTINGGLTLQLLLGHYFVWH